MGAEFILGASALALGAATAGYGMSQNSKAMDRANQLSISEAEKNRQFQAEQVAQQNAQQEKLYSKYQSPEAVARQLKEIGVNPASYFGSGQGVGSVPSVASPASGSQAQIQANTSNGAIAASAMKDASAGIHSLAQAARTKEERENLRRQSDLILAQKFGQDALNNHQAIVNMVDGWALNEKAKVEINELLSRAGLNYANGDLAAASADYQKILKRIGEKDFDIKAEEAAQAPYLFANQVKLLDAKIKTEKSQQVSNYAAAGASKAQAEHYYATAEEARSQAELIKKLTPHQVSEAKSAAQKAKLGNLSEAYDIVDKAFGTDKGAGAYIKTLFVNGDLTGRRWQYFNELLDGSSLTDDELDFLNSNIIDDSDYRQIPKHKKRRN